MTDQPDPVATAHAALLADTTALERLAALRGWTPDAITRLGIGIDQGRILIPVTDPAGEVVALLRYQPNPDKRQGQPKLMSTPGSKRELFPTPESIPGDTVWLVEGEPDAITAHSIGLPACGIPGSSSWRPEWAERLTSRSVVICCDCDKPGRTLAAQAADSLLDHARDIRIVDLAPARDDGYDLTDTLRDTGFEHTGARQVLERLAADAPPHLPENIRPPRPRLTTNDWRQALSDYLDGKDDSPAWEIPFDELREATDGGIRPGEVWVIAGWTSNGKSIFTDMIADTTSQTGALVHLYLTEMTVVQRGLRLLSRRTGVPLRHLRKRAISPQQRDACKRALARLPYAASVVTDWTPAQVAADIAATRTNVAIVDLLHGFDYQDERELSGIVTEFARAASTDTAGHNGSAVILVCQLNDGQMRDARSVRRPKPGMHSLKGSSWIKQRADVVLFVWLEDDDDGNPTTNGEIWIAKNRNGDRATVPVELDPLRLVFEERNTGRAVA